MKAGMSGWVTPSAANTVAMTWVSSRKPSENSGRMDRSMKRQTRISRSASLPSRLKKPPGILPAADVFSTKSTVRGKKSIPSRGVVDVTVTSTTVSPYCTTAAPAACLAMRPVSIESVRPPICVDTVAMSNQ
jgi:hypothetical protein